MMVIRVVRTKWTVDPLTNVPLFRGIRRFESLIPSYQSRFDISRECNKRKLMMDEGDEGGANEVDGGPPDARVLLLP